MKIYSVVSRDTDGEPLAVVMTRSIEEAADIRALLRSRGHVNVLAYEAKPTPGHMGSLAWFEMLTHQTQDLA